MNQLQKQGQPLIRTEDTIFVKIPDEVYQSWWQMADQMNARNKPIEERQKILLECLTDWIDCYYPAYGLIAFEDFANWEAEEAARKTGLPITWGMYVLLQVGGSMQPVSLTDKLLDYAKNKMGG